MTFTPGEINIICSDLQKSLQFYRDVLGFIPTIDEEGFYHMVCGERQYLLLPNAKPVAQTVDYGSVPQFSMDLYVDNIEQAYAHCQAAEVAFATEWREGAVMFVIRDPDGLPWEIIKRSS